MEHSTPERRAQMLSFTQSFLRESYRGGSYHCPQRFGCRCRLEMSSRTDFLNHLKVEHKYAFRRYRDQRLESEEVARQAQIVRNDEDFETFLKQKYSVQHLLCKVKGCGYKADDVKEFILHMRDRHGEEYQQD